MARTPQHVKTSAPDPPVSLSCVALSLDSGPPEALALRPDRPSERLVPPLRRLCVVMATQKAGEQLDKDPPQS